MSLSAVLQSLAQAFGKLKFLIPGKGWWRLKNYNFITLHYLYMIFMSLLVSGILADGIPYIDSLFFAAGSATQSGLNTIDVNQLFLYQQVVLMMTACLTNPIFINSSVVFVRLYWFEKRFKHIVRDARELRKTWEKSRTKSEARAQDDPGKVERGVNGRSIKVLHETTRPNGMNPASSHDKEEAARFAEKLGIAPHHTPVDSAESNSGSSNGKRNDTSENATLTSADPAEHEDKAEPESEPPAHRTITFPDQLPTPAQPDISQHIAFVQRQQQNAKDESGTLRIPGPRDFDRGELPEEVARKPSMAPTRRGTAESNDIHRVTRMLSENSEKEHEADQHPRHAITFSEPQHRPQHGRTSEDNADAQSNKNVLTRLVSPFNVLRQRRSGHDLGDGRSTFARTVTNFSKTFSTAKGEESQPYFNWEATIGRNSAFINLNAAQREELGGIEYRALKMLAKILIIYFVGFHVFGMLVYLPWIIYTEPWRDVVVADGINPGWWGVFTPASMFNDLGLTLTPDSMISFQYATLILLVGSFLIVIGNTGFPVMLRFIIWLCAKFTTPGSPTNDELRFLLDHPRRCFTLLFPSSANWWLFGILFALNAIDLIFFIVLDLNDSTVTSLPAGLQTLNGFFQATSTRTAGFSSVNIANLHPAIQVSYMIMMYISVLPIAISVRRTNVYEEKSLGIYGGEDHADPENPSYVGQHLRRQLSFDLWYIFLGFFIIAIVEGDRLAAMDDPAFSMFAVLFEIVSAYGTVGLSLGYPTINASFSAEFHTLSKLVIVAMMIRGRHRGLPYALDRAIILPSEKQYDKEAEDANRRHERRGSIYTGDAGFSRSKTWEDAIADDEGMSRGGDDDRRSHMDRRGSTVSNASGPRSRSRSKARTRTFPTYLSMALTAGPTFHKDD